MKKAFSWVLLGAALVFFGSACGGGGGTTSTDSTDGGTDSGTLSNVQLIAVLQSSPSTGVGLTNVVVGQQLQLEFIGTNSTGHQVVRQGTGFTTNAPAGVATVSSSGSLSATGASSTTYTVSGVGPAGSQSRDLVVTAANTFVTGRVRNINGTGVANVKVKFYQSNGTLRATASTGPDGTFRAAVPTNVAGFTIDIEQADPPSGPQYYYRQFAFGSKYYLNDADCPVSLPTLTEGTSTALTADIVLADRASGPPPPPSGCLGG